MITDGNSNPHEEMKRARNDKKEGWYNKLYRLAQFFLSQLL